VGNQRLTKLGTSTSAPGHVAQHVATVPAIEDSQRLTYWATRSGTGLTFPRVEGGLVKARRYPWLAALRHTAWLRDGDPLAQLGRSGSTQNAPSENPAS
jgi:hypothetical protein